MALLELMISTNNELTGHTVFEDEYRPIKPYGNEVTLTGQNPPYNCC